MLCATCVSIFQGPSKEGIHHHSFENLVKAADLGCKICICLHRLRGKHGPDEVEEKKCPFTTFSLQISCNENAPLEFEFRSTASWLLAPMENRIQFHISRPGPLPHWWAGYLKGIQQDLITEPWNVREDSFNTRPIPKSTGNVEVAEIGLAWLNTCRNHHSACESIDETRQRDYYPNRVLDVGTLESPILRLITTKVELPAKGNRYATLSHCWGGNASFIRLSTENMALLSKQISLECLPKSFTDAIITCRRLRIRYLWIDSLCILQSGPGSEEDWQTHVAAMHTIYTNCVLNLAVACASSPDQGAFVDRNSSFIKTTCVYAPASMNFHNRNADPSDPQSEDEADGTEEDKTGKAKTDETGRVIAKDKRKAQLEDKSHVCNMEEFCLATIFTESYDFSSSLHRQPLWKRGWVFQERLMTPRMLVFGDDRIYWECHERILNEYLPTGLPGSGEVLQLHNLIPFTLPSIVLRSEPPLTLTEYESSRLYDDWNNILYHYARTDLTYPEKDKLAALAAIAQRFGRVLPGKYCAGLFESDIHLGLLWWQIDISCRLGHFAHSKWTFTFSFDGYRSPKYRAPTWSWASVDTTSSLFGPPIHVRNRIPNQVFRRTLANVESISVELNEPRNPFGQVLSAELVISGTIIHLSSTDLVDDDNSQAHYPNEKLLGLCIIEGMKHSGSVGHISSEVYGIFLTHVGSDKYQRMGYFSLVGPQDSRFPTEDYERKTITII
ncbi:HET-domain-containing protein [Lophium mytilinum]|uniref:HET-domain-containing protein n=1 Tax=Lophium mytilinum TaxID=390894 RepID=A0A6A6QLM5_9PEZI|nr:HET-domain-containing protein [Lophium mytilinum]